MTPSPHERWRPKPLWTGETAFIFGGGPSIKNIDLERLRGRRTIAVNSTAKSVPFADILLFMDTPWWNKNRSFVESWPGLVVTNNHKAKHENPALIRRVVQENNGRLQAGSFRLGRSSGHCAVSLAIMLGASRVVLLGFDMRLIDGRSHHHDEYKAGRDRLYFDFIDGFRGWARDAKLHGRVDIVNATPGSALKEFPFVDLDDELN